MPEAPLRGEGKRTSSYGLSFLRPIIVSVAFSAIFTFLTVNTVYLSPIEFVPESQTGAFGAAINAVILSILPLIGGLILLAILKKRRQLLLRLFIGVGFSLAGSTIFTLILWGGMLTLSVGLQEVTMLVLSIVLSLSLNVALVYTILSARVGQRAKNLAVMIYGGGIGTLLGTALPLWTGLLMVMGISIYDIYSVRRGPIREIVEISKERQEMIPGLSYASSDWEIGLGDLGIYSMLVSLAQAQFGLIACLASSIGIVLGSIMTLHLLRKREFMPGLPLTSLTGSIPILVFIMLSLG